MRPNVLKKIDKKLQKIDEFWPYTSSEQKTMNEIKKVEHEQDVLKKEIELLEQNLYISVKPEEKNEKGAEASATVKSPKEQDVRELENINDQSPTILTPSSEPTDAASNSDNFWLNNEQFR